MKVTKSIIAVLLCLSAGSAYADCEYYLTGNKETLNISDCVDGVKGIPIVRCQTHRMLKMLQMVLLLQPKMRSLSRILLRLLHKTRKQPRIKLRQQQMRLIQRPKMHRTQRIRRKIQRTLLIRLLKMLNRQLTRQSRMRQKKPKRQKRTQTTIQTIKLQMLKMN